MTRKPNVQVTMNKFVFESMHITQNYSWNGYEDYSLIFYGFVSTKGFIQGRVEDL